MLHRLCSFKCHHNAYAVFPSDYCSVSKLQEAIHTSYNIPPDKQVMLISGGENLDPSARVCSYSAGTVSMLHNPWGPTGSAYTYTHGSTCMDTLHLDTHPPLNFLSKFQMILFMWFFLGGCFNFWDAFYLDGHITFQGCVTSLCARVWQVFICTVILFVIDIFCTEYQWFCNMPILLLAHQYSA